MTQHQGEPAADGGWVRERVVDRECASCGKQITYAGTGRRGRYCSARCRQRAWALRTAERALGTPADPRPQVVREVVERERIVIRREPANVVSWVDRPPAVPTRAREWVALLAELEQQLAADNHPIASNHWDHQRLYTALVNAVAALGQAHPGGLDALGRRR